MVNAGGQPAEAGSVSPAVKRVLDAAAALGMDLAVREMPASTRTALEAAAAVGCTVGEIVKSLIFRGRDSGAPFLLLVSGSNRVDEEAVAAHLGEGLVRPDAAYVRDVTGFAIGGIPPFGHVQRLAPFMDRDLLAYREVWAAAGTPRAVFPVDPARLRLAIGATPIPML